MIAILKRSARHWKRSSDYWKRQHEADGEDAGSREELDRVKLERIKLLVANASLKRRLKNYRWLISDNNLDIIRMSKDLDKFTDPDLIKWFIRAKLGLLGGFNIIFFSHNSSPL